MECEFITSIASNLSTVGLDDNTTDMNALKAEKANIKSL
jgi:hypothetical protein